MLYTRVHSWCGARSIFWQMYDDMSPPSEYHTDSFTPLQILSVLLVHHSFSPNPWQPLIFLLFPSFCHFLFFSFLGLISQVQPLGCHSQMIVSVSNPARKPVLFGQVYFVFSGTNRTVHIQIGISYFSWRSRRSGFMSPHVGRKPDMSDHCPIRGTAFTCPCEHLSLDFLDTITKWFLKKDAPRFYL